MIKGSKRKTVMSKNFATVAQANIPRSSFDRSHGVKTTFDGGFLIPFFCDEALPGDTFNLQTSGLIRLSTPIFPIMDNMYLDTFFFAVPLRLIHADFQKMMGEEIDPGDSTSFVTPKVTTPTATSSNLWDYLGVPVVSALETVAYWSRAYNFIYNHWFRDENLQDSVVVDTDAGPDTESNYVLLRRGKRHDYFTSCLPWPQKGGAVELPLGTSAPVTGTVTMADTTVDNSDVTLISVDGNANIWQNDDGSIDAELTDGAIGHSLIADLSTATAATINQWRQALQIQKLHEIDARSGTRYTEIIKGHFQVTSPDARLQRPEYLGGGSARINITPVAGTNPAGSSLIGQLGAFGTSVFHNHGFTKSFTEHCVILGLVNVRADLTYQQGLNRMFSRDDKLDFYWPALSIIGEQAVLNKEIYMDSTGNDILVFGYQERYAEYRYKPSTIHGIFRSNAAASLDAWHLSQDFSTLPVLNAAFIVDNPPIARVVAVDTEPEFIADFYHHLICARPMPMHGIPASLGRF